MKINDGKLACVVDAVFGKDGSIDASATVAKFAEELQEFVRFESESSGEVLAALDQVWTAYPGARMNQAFIVGQALRNLGEKVTPKTHALYSEKCLAMIAALAERGIVEVKKGRDGGTKYIPESERKA